MTSIPEQQSTGFTPKMALCLAAIMLADADGHFHEEELAKLRTLVQADEQAFLSAFQFFQDRPAEMCLKVIAGVLNDAQKRSAIAVLYDIAKADGILQPEENDMIRRFAVEFELPVDALTSKSLTKQFDPKLFE